MRKLLENVSFEELEIIQEELAEVFKVIFNTILDVVKENKKFIVPQFGIFELKPQPERIVRNPRTNETIEVPAGNKLIFTAGNFEDIDGMSHFINKLEKLSYYTLSIDTFMDIFSKIFTTILEILENDDDINIAGLGKFKIKYVRIAKEDQIEMFRIPATGHLLFKQSPYAKKRLN